ncbi:iron chelate uptake ABC transporter family permease subunit, partial [Escherichia coli]|uniref:iron chelate uptake ABC transporter family permease subunit n=1 Tax=Escherichia coli TaxID=562 RepID=UPI00227E8418
IPTTIFSPFVGGDILQVLFVAVLFGIALVFTFNALVSMMQFIASEDTLQGLVFWTMGSLARASWDKLGILFGVFAVLLPLSMMSSWKLTALRLGEDRAVSFGI